MFKCARTVEVEHLKRREVRVDAAHEALEEDDVREADGERAQVAREGVQVCVLVQLHGARKVHTQVAQRWAAVRELA